MIHLTFSNQPIDEVSSCLSLITIFEDIRPLKGSSGLADWRMNGKLSKLILSSRFQGAEGEALLMPTRGRLDSQELLLMGLGKYGNLNEHHLPGLLHLIVEKILLKRVASFSISLSDFVTGMFEWRNAVRLFISMLSGTEGEISVTLVERPEYIEDAKKRHMDFAYDVEVRY